MKSVTYTPTTRKVAGGYQSLVLAYQWKGSMFITRMETNTTTLVIIWKFCLWKNT